MSRCLAPLLALGALAGCTVGPNYAAPRAEVPAAFAEPQGAGAPTDIAAWWTGFGDAELDRLVTAALADSLDVKTAASRIRQARAAERGARAEELPEVDASANATYLKFSKNAGLSSLTSLFGGGSSGGGAAGGGAAGGGAAGGGGASQGGIALPGDSVTTYSTGFDASWEIDLFGGVRRTVEGAGARTQAAVWNGRDAAVSLVAEVADAYLQLRLAQQRELVANDEIARQQRSLQLAGDRARAGLVPEGDTIQQRAQLATAQAAVPMLVAEQRAQMHALAVLLARPPGALIVELSQPNPPLLLPPAVPAGLPSDLLRRRPDIRAAERNLAAATADIGVAVSQLYPSFSLTAMPQLISTALGNLFTGNSLQLTGSAAISFPVLDFGRIRAQINQRKEVAEQAYLQYQRTVLGALRDVEDALARVATEQDRNKALRGGVADAERSVKAVQARYRTGLTTFTDVLDAQQAVLSNRDQLAQSDGMLRRDLVSLYKALGGGWAPDAATDAGAAPPLYAAARR